MIRKSDVRWWVLEATKHPESAPQIVEALANRLIELDGLNEHLRDELIQMRRRLARRRDSTQVTRLQHQVQTLQRVLEHQSTSGSLVVFLTDNLRAAAAPLPAVQEAAAARTPLIDAQHWAGLAAMFIAWPGDHILVLTSLGKALDLQVDELTPLTQGPGQRPSSAPPLRSRERAAAARPVRIAPRFWTVITARGYAQRVLRAALERQSGGDVDFVQSPHRNDQPVDIVEGDQGDILVLSRLGQYARFAHRAIGTHGSQALELEPGDEIVAAMGLVEEQEILILTGSGYAMRRDTQQLVSKANPGGVGRGVIQAHDVLSVSPYESEAHLLCLTYSGKVKLFPMGDLPLLNRSSKGSLLEDLRRDPIVASAMIKEAS